MPASATGSATVARLCLLADPPSLDKGEITDKGSINQRRALPIAATVTRPCMRDDSLPNTYADAKRNCRPAESRRIRTFNRTAEARGASNGRRPVSRITVGLQTPAGQALTIIGAWILTHVRVRLRPVVSQCS